VPDKARLRGTSRCFDEHVETLMQSEIKRIVASVAAAHGVEATYERDPNPYPPTVNDPDAARFAHGVMAGFLGEEKAIWDHPPALAGEDFAFLAREVPGAFAIIGNGDSAALHNPAYEFDDRVLPLGVAYWVRLAEAALPAG